MKKTVLLILIGLTLIASVGLGSIYFWVKSDVKANIEIAQSIYKGNPEEALISFLLDDSNSPNDRTHIAIWTLGQIKSAESLPILNELYTDDPDGETCYGKHDHLLCQYEIYKAIEAINGNTLFTYKG